MSSLDVVFVTGLSGSGKSTAIRVLEDLGYYCIDNLPVVLIPRFLELCEQSSETIPRVALGIDVRERAFFSDYPGTIDELQSSRESVHVLFLDASDETLVRRFSETRRPHPLAGREGPLHGIRQERLLLDAIRERADRVLDTTDRNVHQLREELIGLYADPGAGDRLTLTLMSFGFKFGLPRDADTVFDARCLPNPFFVEELRSFTGRDEAVAEYVMGRGEAAELIARIHSFLSFALPLHRREGKSYFTVSIGCTGGRHRSVVLVERLAERMRGEGLALQVRHRDMER